jgi:hypothetical protein
VLGFIFGRFDLVRPLRVYLFPHQLLVPLHQFIMQRHQRRVIRRLQPTNGIPQGLNIVMIATNSTYSSDFIMVGHVTTSNLAAFLSRLISRIRFLTIDKGRMTHLDISSGVIFRPAHSSTRLMASR